MMISNSEFLKLEKENQIQLSYFSESWNETSPLGSYVGGFLPSLSATTE